MTKKRLPRCQVLEKRGRNAPRRFQGQLPVPLGAWFLPGSSVFSLLREVGARGLALEAALCTAGSPQWPAPRGGRGSSLPGPHHGRPAGVSCLPGGLPSLPTGPHPSQRVSAHPTPHCPSGAGLLWPGLGVGGPGSSSPHPPPLLFGHQPVPGVPNGHRQLLPNTLRCWLP